MILPAPLDVGVIVGRFQVPDLHEGHKHLFNTVLARHKRVLVILGIPMWVGGIDNPLDYKTRELMIKTAYPDVVVAHIRDQKTNEEWSEDVDNIIESLYPFAKAILYGGRKGFTSQYRGHFQTVETLEDPAYDKTSGTAIRLDTASLPRNSSDFRAGVIYGNQAKPDGVCMCIDAAVIRNQSGIGPQILLVRKPMEEGWRFPGGRLDRGDDSLESAVRREVCEETGVEVGTPHYVCSEGGVPDWRAQRVGIGITSALFYLPYIYGAPKGKDDVAEAQWFDLAKVTQQTMEPCHRSLIDKFKTWAMENYNTIIQYSHGSKQKEAESGADS